MTTIACSPPSTGVESADAWRAIIIGRGSGSGSVKPSAIESTGPIASRPTAATPEPVEIPAGERGAWRVEEAFIGAIRGVEPVTLNDFATGVAYMAFTDAVHASAETGARVRP